MPLQQTQVHILVLMVPHIVQVMPDIESAEVPVYLAYPEELRQSKRVAAFKDFVQEEIITYRKQWRERVEGDN